MAKDKDIEFIIEKDGSVTIEGMNFDGKGCHEAIQEYVKKLGSAKSSKKKREFYNQKASNNKNVIGGG